MQQKGGYPRLMCAADNVFEARGRKACSRNAEVCLLAKDSFVRKRQNVRADGNADTAAGLSLRLRKNLAPLGAEGARRRFRALHVPIQVQLSLPAATLAYSGCHLTSPLQHA